MVILGGGIFGCILALYTKHHLPNTEITILDPHERLLNQWNTRSAACGMQFLRSPASHCVGHSFTALLSYARQHAYSSHDFQMPYWRPSLRLFNAAARHMIDQYDLEGHHNKAEVKTITKKNDHWILETDQGNLLSDVVILAPGRKTMPIAHGISVFDHNFSLHSYTDADECLVFGAGMTGVQIALSLISAGAIVHLVSQYPLCTQQFDSNPCYIGPKCKDMFLREKDVLKRKDILKEARYPGSITPHLFKELHNALKKHPKRFCLHQSMEEYQKYVRLAKELPAKQVIVAQGFDSAPPLPNLIQSIAQSTGAQITKDGFPIPNVDLEWENGLFLTGMLSELVVGPAAQNIIGAHLAARRIISRLSKKMYC